MNNTPKPPKYQIDEVRDIHPLVALWLTKNGYAYIHEYKMPDYGRVDFYATHPNGQKLLVEAKGESDAVWGIFQVRLYGMQIPDADILLSLPREYITKEIEEKAAKYNVPILALDFDYEEAIKKEVIKKEITELEREFKANLCEGVNIGIALQREKGVLWKEGIDVINGSLCAAVLMHFCVLTNSYSIDDESAVKMTSSIVLNSHSAFRSGGKETTERWVYDTIHSEHWYLFAPVDDDIQ